VTVAELVLADPGIDIVADYEPHGAVRDAINCRDAEVVCAGPADTGKTLGLLNKLDVCARRYPGASIVIARKQLTDTFGTVLQTFARKVIHREIEAGIIKVYGGEKAQWFDYPNGSRIWVAGLDKSSKVLSAEFDLVYINQAEEVSLPDWEVLTTRVTGRAGNMPYSQLISDANPGPPTHWIKSRARSGQLTLFESTHRDNPEIYAPVTGEITEGGRQRLLRLRSLTGSRKQRLFLGLWAAPEGAIYDVFEEERHQVASFVPQPTWPRTVGIDPVGAYVGALWAAWDPQARVLNIYREYLESFGVPTRKHAENILALTRPESVFAWYCGAPSERQHRADFQSHGIPCVAPPYGDFWPGIDRVNELLTDFALVVHDCCVNLLSEIASYRRVMKDGIPTDAVEDKHSFHLLDCLRYLVVGLTGPREDVGVSYAPVQVGQGRY
jgi:hypothetical protein